MELKQNNSLRSIFIRYILFFMLGTAALAVLYWFIISLLFAYQFLLPANYYEQMLKDNRVTIAESAAVTEDMIPKVCKYGIFNKDGSMTSGSFNLTEADSAWKALKDGQNAAGGSQYYKIIQRKNEICIVKYPIMIQFGLPELRKSGFSPELLLVIIFIILMILEVLLLSTAFGRLISGEMDKLTETANEIKSQNLNFKTRSSGIKEVNDVIDSLNQMQSALKSSLETQWNLEQARKTQISALTHDIKTPLTIIKGNAELIKEINLDRSETANDSRSATETLKGKSKDSRRILLGEDMQEITKYNGYIITNTEEIERYLKLLIDMLKTEDSCFFHPSFIQTGDFIDKLQNRITNHAFLKNLNITFLSEMITTTFFADEELLTRAIMNVVINAIDYSKSDSELIIRFCENEDWLQFIITDYGKGFTNEDLLFAQEQFYRGDKSRRMSNHYGMGLYISNSFAALHKGSLELENSPDTGGARVTIQIPLIKER